MVYNMMSCAGFSKEFFGGCTMAWLVLAILVFLVLIARRQLTDYTDFPFNLIGGFVGAFLPFLLIITFTGSTRFAFLAGLIGLFVGGYLFSLVGLDGGGDYD